MRHHFLGLLASVSLLAGAQASAQGGATMNYEDADLKVVAGEIADRTGYSFILDPRLSGRVNIVSPPNVMLTPEEVFEVFLATLQVNNFTAVPTGDRSYKIVPIEQGARDGGPVGGSSVGGRTVTRIFPLANIDAANAAAQLRGLVGPQGLILAVRESNSLIVVDNGRNVDRVRQVLEDIDLDDTVVRTVSLENGDATQVAEALREILNQPTGDRQLGGSVQIIPSIGTNQIILRGSPQQVSRAVPIIAQLDNSGGIRGNFDAIYLDHADGEELVPIISELIGGSSASGGGAAQAGGGGGTTSVSANGIVVTFHQPTNAILVNAPPEAQRTIRQLVAQLDIRRPQVLIEAIVVEIANNTARELGVQYLSGGDGLPVTAASFTDTQPNLVSAAGAAFFLTEDLSAPTQIIPGDGTNPDIVVNPDPVDPNVLALSGQLVQAAVGDLLSFNGFLAGFGETTDDGGVYGVLLSALQSDSRSNVLSTPFTMALDNEPARLQVGQEIPVVTGEAVGTDFQGGFRNIERQDVGTILEVTPQINDGDAVTLEIKLEVSSLTAFTADSDSPILQKSVSEQKLTADNGQMIVIGGLVDNDQRSVETKVPLLGDIPILGNLFKGQTRSEEETTLMVFIKPTIVRDAATAQAVTAKKYDFARQRQLRAERRERGPARIDRVQEELLGVYLEGQEPIQPDEETLSP
ncbi:type II secretion system secretin GspD [Parvularcula maris]|uniref:Type II secretion system secretin GspD n=1 Tax=Parvularcula maris TaxID=2965077 RepID=A0A9X2RHN9_9PROT|nr:type II secretion system secretin GspD [Parvularcula maris]MCQ8185054.1 type II secretion system secretin GspD [Parvularcula maris]